MWMKRSGDEPQIGIEAFWKRPVDDSFFYCFGYCRDDLLFALIPASFDTATRSILMAAPAKFLSNHGNIYITFRPRTGAEFVVANLTHINNGKGFVSCKRDIYRTIVVAVDCFRV